MAELTKDQFNIKWTSPLSGPFRNQDTEAITDDVMRDFAKDIKDSFASTGNFVSNIIISSLTTVSSSQLNNSASTPVVLVPAPGANKMIGNIQYVIKASGTTTLDSGHLLYLTHGFSVLHTVTNNLDVNASGYFMDRVNLNFAGVNISLIENQGLFISSSIDSSGGDVSLQVFINYQIIEFN